VANPPNDQIYDFKGYIEMCNFEVLRRKSLVGSEPAKSPGPTQDLLQNPISEESSEGGVQREALSLENTMWANTVLASNGVVHGMIVYTGKETRAQMNSKVADTKVGKLDLELNRLSKLLFIFMVILSFGIVAWDEFKGNWLISFFRFVLLLSAIIPISLRVNLDMGKVYYCWGIYNDEDIPGTIPRNSTIPEELGRVQFLLTDKTGTLTKNDMIFKKLNMEFATFSLDNIQDLKQMVKLHCQAKPDPGPLADLFDRDSASLCKSLNSLDLQMGSEVSTSKVTRKKGGQRRDESSVVRDLVTALALCHNVTPTYPDPKNPNQVEYQASSPDEIALVKFAESLDIKPIARDQQKLQIKNAAGVVETYHIVANFPFSSETKRMGILMKHEGTGRLVFYLKGAETVMKHKVRPNQRVDIDEYCENLANEGLRTLVISQKYVSEEFYESWSLKYEEAKADLNDREALIAQCVEELEQDMELLGVTGVEDRLQDNVAVVIESLRNAGI
jgi:phospholipid-translocating ATPase